MRSDFRTLVEIQQHAAREYAGRVCVAVKREGRWQTRTYAELGRDIDAARGGLAALGVRKGDRVALICDNCPEWEVVAFAAYGLGAWLVPMYQAQLAEEWAFIIQDCEASVLLAGDAQVAGRLAPRLPSLPSVKSVVVLRGEPGGVPGALSYVELLERGHRTPAPVATVEPDDVAGLLYTSGTTGHPKGVMLTHGNFASNVDALVQTFPIDPAGETSLAFLPWAHSYGQTTELYTGMATGGTAYLAESTSAIMANLLEARPTILFSVPRVWNKVYQGLNRKMEEESGLKLALYRRALDVARRREELKARGQRSLGLELAHAALDRLVFAKIRAALGGRLKYAVSGAAALSPEVARFLAYVGITVCEGYGLTETSPVATNNRPGSGRIGTVGQALPGVRIEIRPVEDAPQGQGEIVIHGPNVMKGYYRRPEETQAALLPDGGLRTGDLGFLDADGYLHVTGRVKEQFKLENGKYVAPAPLEEHLKLSPYVAQAFVYGSNRPSLVVLVVPEPTALAAWCAKNGVAARPLADLCRDPKVRELFRAEIDAKARDFRGFERIAEFTLVPDDFTTDNGLLTQTLKLRRRLVEARYQRELAAMYAAPVAA